MDHATIGQRLRLAPHVRACRSDGQIVLLDLRSNRYLGIGPRQADALVGAIDDWPSHPESTGTQAICAHADNLTRHLLSLGLLVPSDSLAATRPSIPESTSTLSAEGRTTTSAATATHLARLLRCAAVTALWMRCRSLNSIANAVAARRDRALTGRTDRTSPDAMRDAIATYDRLRPLVLTKHDRCVHDSLTLLGFLASEGLFPHWVIGVKTGPFGAHSWVQSGATVLNDLHENVRRYRPILVV
jgi:hypothetical protein